MECHFFISVTNRVNKKIKHNNLSCNEEIFVLNEMCNTSIWCLYKKTGEFIPNLYEDIYKYLSLFENNCLNLDEYNHFISLVKMLQRQLCRNEYSLNEIWNKYINIFVCFFEKYCELPWMREILSILEWERFYFI